MKKILALALAATTAATLVSAADARQGCGPGMHRGWHNRCVSDRGPVVRERWVVGRFYAGRGYWDGHRWYQHRTRWHGGWRYR